MNLIDKRVDYIPSDDIYDVLVDACMLQFDFVKQYCIKNLEGNINEDTCLRIWQVAEQLDIKDLASKAKCKALMDFNDVRHTRGLLLLNIKELHSYLSNTMLHCNCEMDVFEAGIRWWYDHCNRNVQMELCNQEEITKYQTKHLLVILRCLDYTVMMISDIDNIFLLCLDISENIFTRNVLNSVAKLISGTQVSDQTLEDRTAVELYHNCRPRQLSYLPCIVCQEFNDNYNKRKRTKYSSCNCVNTINLYFYGKYLSVNVICTLG